MSKIGNALTYAPMLCAFVMTVYTVWTVLSKLQSVTVQIGGMIK